MSDEAHVGTGQVLLDEFLKVDVPELRAIHKSVSEGSRLTDGQLVVMKRYLDNSQELAVVVEAFPEYKEIVGGTIEVYHEIMELALKNERGD